MLELFKVTYYDDDLVEGVEVNLPLVLFVILVVAVAARLAVGA